MNAMTPPSAIVPMIPETAPFSEEQRAWLNGFFAGLLSDTQAPVPLVGDGLAMPGQGGAAAEEDDGAPWHDQTLPMKERMELADGRPMRRRLMAAMAQQDCGQCGYNCLDYANAIHDQAEERLNLCVPGGKETARMVKALVEELGGGATDPDVSKVKAEEQAKEKLRKGDQRPGRSRETPAHAVFLGRAKLNKGASEKSTYHIDFDLSASQLDYVVGDSFGIFPRNEARLVELVMQAIGAPHAFPIGDKTLHEVLTYEVSLGLAPDMLFELISYMVGGERRMKAKALAKGEDPDGDAATLDVLGALEKFPGVRPDPEALIEVLEPLQPRLYSISSSHNATPGRVSLTVDHVRYTIEDRDRFGVASTFVGYGLEPGEKVRAYVQKAHDFALPSEGGTPIIMCGPGTGLAPFRAFLQERMASKAAGDAWLFFGHQRRDCDFFYEDELTGFLSKGTLTKLSLAWSRDGGKKVYVQDKMREAAAELWSWLERGAHFYVCGDAKRMAADVEKALIAVHMEHGGMDEAAAKARLKELRALKRYQTDVY